MDGFGRPGGMMDDPLAYLDDGDGLPSFDEMAEDEEEELPPPPPANVLSDYLWTRSIGGERRRIAESFAAEKLPDLLREVQLPNVHRFDKMFASAWLDHEHVLVGTKDNQLVRWNTNSGDYSPVPALGPGPPPELPHCGQHNVDLSPSRSLVATGGADPRNCGIYGCAGGRLAPLACLQGHRDWLFGCAWIDDFLVLSASRDHTVKLWSVKSHADRYFAALDDAEDAEAVWREEAILRSEDTVGSGDSTAGSIALEESLNRLRLAGEGGHLSGRGGTRGGRGEDRVAPLPATRPRSDSGSAGTRPRSNSSHGESGTAIIDDTVPIVHPLVSLGAAQGGHSDRVRGIVYLPAIQQVSSLSLDGTVKIWDRATMDCVSTINLKERVELVCMSADNDNQLVAVGSQQHITYIDPRSSQPVMSVRSQDDRWGVRSLSINNNIATIGGGFGRVSFFDFRSKQYMLLHQGDKPRRFWCTGGGWLRKDVMYYEHFRNASIANAVYTHCYDSSGTRLFTGGGPLQFGLCGSYAAVW